MEEEESGERRSREWGTSKNGVRSLEKHSYIYINKDDYPTIVANQRREPEKARRNQKYFSSWQILDIYSLKDLTLHLHARIKKCWILLFYALYIIRIIIDSFHIWMNSIKFRKNKKKT